MNNPKLRLAQRRINNLYANGFTLFEARTLKKIPLAAPYMQMLIRDRKALLKEAIKKDYTAEKYKMAINHMYNVRGYKDTGNPIRISSVFKMLRDYEDQFYQYATDDDIERWKRLSPPSKKSHHAVNINHERVKAQKREYNARPEVKAKRAEYRRTHKNKKSNG